ncbi:hypothetical protein [Ralstonia pseudosolanacearum]
MRQLFLLYAVAVVIGATYMNWKAGFATPRSPSYGSSSSNSSNSGSSYWGGSSGSGYGGGFSGGHK